MPKQKQVIVKDRRLKAKNVERLRELQFKHPGDRTPEEQAEFEKLEGLSLNYGERTE